MCCSISNSYSFYRHVFKLNVHLYDMQRLKETQLCVLVYAHLVKAYTHTHTQSLCCHSSSCLLLWCPLLRALILFPSLVSSDPLWCWCLVVLSSPLSSLPSLFLSLPFGVSRQRGCWELLATQHSLSLSSSSTVLFSPPFSVHFSSNLLLILICSDARLFHVLLSVFS